MGKEVKWNPAWAYKDPYQHFNSFSIMFYYIISTGGPHSHNFWDLEKSVLCEIRKNHIFWQGHNFLPNLLRRFVISSVDLSYVVPVKYIVEILHNFVAFSEYMNFTSENFYLALREEASCSNSSTRPLKNDSDSRDLDISAESLWFSCWYLFEDSENRRNIFQYVFTYKINHN